MPNTIIYSLVIPVFRGAPTLSQLTDEVRKVFYTMNQSFEIIFVDDSGGEINWPIICQLKEAYPSEIRGIQLSRNYGQHPATFCGLLHSRGQFVITMDEDLQHSPVEIPRLIAHQQTMDYDLVYGTYPPLQHSWLRQLSSGLFRKILSCIFPSLSSQFSSFRLLKSNLLDSLRSKPFVPDFLDAYWVRGSSRVSSIEVNHRASQAGKSSYSWAKLSFHAWNVLRTLAKIHLPRRHRLRKYFAHKPNSGMHIKEIL